MNEDFGTNHSIDNSPLDAELQVRLMNLVMGEASDFESDQLQLLMEQRPEVAAYYQHLVHLHGLLSEVGTGELHAATEPGAANDVWQLPTDRRNQVLAVLNGETLNPQSKAVEPNQAIKTRWFLSSRWMITGLAAAACLIVALMLPRRRMTSLARSEGFTSSAKNNMGVPDEMSARDTTADVFAQGLRKQAPTVRFAEQDKPGTIQLGAIALNPDGTRRSNVNTFSDDTGPLNSTADAPTTNFGSTAGVASNNDQWGRPIIGQTESRYDWRLRNEGQQSSTSADRFSSNVPVDRPEVRRWDVEKGYALTTPAAEPQIQPAKPQADFFGVTNGNDGLEPQLPQAENYMELMGNAGTAKPGEATLSQKEGEFIDAMNDVAQASKPDSSGRALQEYWYTNPSGGQQGGSSMLGRGTNGRDDSKVMMELAPHLIIDEEEVRLQKDNALSLSVGGKESTDGKQNTTDDFRLNGQIEQKLQILEEAGDVVAELSRKPESSSQYFRNITPDNTEVIAGVRVLGTESKPQQNREMIEANEGKAATKGKDSKRFYDSAADGESDAKREKSASNGESGSQGLANTSARGEVAKGNSVAAGRSESLPPAYYLKDDVQNSSAPRRLQEPKKQVGASLEEQSTAANAFSTFSLHVSDVSFKLAQAALNQNQYPEAAKIRIEEFVNAIDYHDPLPSNEEKVACRVEQSIHPFLMQRNMLRISMRTGASGRAQNTPLRLTLLLDNSGSMERPDRRQAVYQAFKTLTQQLTPADQVTLISFASTPRLLADKVPGNQGEQLLKLIENLPSEGGTNIEAALQLAREKATEQQIPGAQNRIVLMTDGAVNLGDANPASLAKMVTQMRDSGIAFDAAGISTHDLNDEVLEALTRQGDGRYYLIDSTETASDSFAAQIAGALRPSAQNVKVQVEFNPQRVSRYKLLGFDKHQLKQEDFRNDRVDAAEMAAAEAGVAMYQFEAKPNGSGDIGSVSVRFRDIATGNMIERRWPIPYEPSAPRLEQASPTMQIATAASLFAAKLIGGPLADSVDLAELNSVLGTLPEPFANQPRVQQLKTMIEQVRKM